MNHACLACGVLLVLAGCAQQPHRVADAFPGGARAAPWILENPVWTGTITQASTGLGADFEPWSKLGPQRVWLAVYRHQSNAEQSLIVRAFAFESREAAARAYDALEPFQAKPFRIGDRGCWTDDGVLFVWGRLVFELFGERPAWESQTRGAYLAGCIEKSMPPGAPEDPQ